MERRSFLSLSLSLSLSLPVRTSQYLVAGLFLQGCSGNGLSGARLNQTPREPQPQASSNLANLGPLQTPDTNGIRLPVGFQSRIVARSGEDPTGASGYLWHDAPDGGAVFAADDGGWIYVSNSELDSGNGGAGALRFDPSGFLLDAYPILTDTTRNCAGGRTPWQTWLSCEETASGLVWECDPSGRNMAVARPSLGRFRHEAAVIHPATGQVYLTEDQPDGRFYRFTPEAGTPVLTTGSLEVAAVDDSGVVAWLPVPDPGAGLIPTRAQVPASTAFNGGEGMAYFDGEIFFSTKGDNRVWAYDTRNSTLSIIYDRKTALNPILSGVDNLEVSAFGDLLVAEDGGNMEIVVIASDGSVVPLLQISEQTGSEITGPGFSPGFSPSNNRLYFSSQRGPSGRNSDGITYEVSGPFTSER